MSHAETSPPSILPLAAIGTLVLVSVLGIGAARLAGLPLAEPEAPVVSQRNLYFEDRADGGIDIVDAEQRHVIDTVLPGTNGFLRSTMRGMARERKRHGLGPAQPFALTAHADGRLLLADPATGRTLDLGAFGASNLVAFAKLLPRPAAQPKEPA